MTGCSDIGQKLPNISKIGFTQFVTTRIFLKNRALSFLYPYDALTLCKKLEKTNLQSLKYLKTDYRPTDGPRKDKGELYGPHCVNVRSNIVARSNINMVENKKMPLLIPSYNILYSIQAI